MTGSEVIRNLRAADAQALDSATTAQQLRSLIACYELSKAAGQALRRVILAAWRAQTCTTSDDLNAALAWLQGLAEQGGQDCPDPAPADVLTQGEVADWEAAAAHLVNLAGAGE